jgi:uncharacterized protein (TIGR02246 family)
MSHRIRKFVSISVLVIVTCALSGAAIAQEPEAGGGDEAAIRAAIDGWLAASQAKDAEGFASYYTEDAVLMLAGFPDPRGRESIAAVVGGMMQDPNFDLSFEPADVVVAASGDLAFETGTYSLTMSDPEGSPATERGQYVVVWRKQPDGAWKVAIDAPVSDPAS